MDLATKTADQTLRCARFALLVLALAAAIIGSQAPASAHSLGEVSPDADSDVDSRIVPPAFSMGQIDLIGDNDLVDQLPNVFRLPRDLGFRFDDGLASAVEIRSEQIGACLGLCGDQPDAVRDSVLSR